MNSYPAEPPVRKGIPVRPNREPAVPTIVFAPDFRAYCDWCYSCRVNPNSRDMKFAGVCEPSPFRTYGNDHGFGPAPDYALKWKQVAFLYVNPEEYYYTWSNNAWSDLERMRRNNQFTRAFYYPDIRNIRPDVTDEGRSWD